MDAIDDIIAERNRQIHSEGWTVEHDDEHANGDLAKAAACYALGTDMLTNLGGARIRIWPWMKMEWKPSDARRNLIKAGALIIAEIERLDRSALPRAEKEMK